MDALHQRPELQRVLEMFEHLEPALENDYMPNKPADKDTSKMSSYARPSDVHNDAEIFKNFDEMTEKQ